MALIDQLAPYRIERVVSSPYLRCIQTVLPLAVAARTAATLDDRLAEGAADRGVRELLGELAGASVAICTHGDVMLALVGRDAEARKGSTWLLDGDTLEPLEYLPPPVLVTLGQSLLTLVAFALGEPGTEPGTGADRHGRSVHWRRARHGASSR